MLAAVKRAEIICQQRGPRYELAPEISHFYHLVRSHTEAMMLAKCAKAERETAERAKNSTMGRRMAEYGKAEARRRAEHSVTKKHEWERRKAEKGRREDTSSTDEAAEVADEGTDEEAEVDADAEPSEEDDGDDEETNEEGGDDADQGAEEDGGAGDDDDRNEGADEGPNEGSGNQDADEGADDGAEGGSGEDANEGEGDEDKADEGADENTSGGDDKGAGAGAEGDGGDTSDGDADEGADEVISEVALDGNGPGCDNGVEGADEPRLPSRTAAPSSNPDAAVCTSPALAGRNADDDDGEEAGDAGDEGIGAGQGASLAANGAGISEDKGDEADQMTTSERERGAVATRSPRGADDHHSLSLTLLVRQEAATIIQAVVRGKTVRDTLALCQRSPRAEVYAFLSRRAGEGTRVEEGAEMADQEAPTEDAWRGASRGCSDDCQPPIATAALLAAWAVEGKRQRRQLVAPCEITYEHQQDAEFNMVIALQGKGGMVVTGCNFLFERRALGPAAKTMLLRCEEGLQLLELEVQYTEDGEIANPIALDEAMGVVGHAHSQLREGKVLAVAVKVKGWGKEGHHYLHRTVLLMDTTDALYYDPTSLVRGEYIRVQCEGFLPYLGGAMRELQLRLITTRGEADACRQGQTPTDASMCNLLSAVAVAAAALPGLAGALSVIRCLQDLGPDILTDVAKYGLPEIWDSAHRDDLRGAASEGRLTPHSLLDPEVYERFETEKTRISGRIVRSLEMKIDEPRAMRVADRDFAVCHDGHTTVYYTVGQGFATVPHRGTDDLSRLLLEGGPGGKLLKWEFDNEREKWTTCVDPHGRYVAAVETTGGVGSVVSRWGSSTVGDLWNQVQCGRTTLRAAIAKATKSTDLTKGEATQVLGGRDQAEACGRHHSLGRPIHCLSVPLKAQVVRLAFDFAGIGVEIDAASECCREIGVKMRNVYLSESHPALRRVLLDNLARDAYDAPLIGERAGFADGSTAATKVAIVYASPPCPQHKNDANGVVTGHDVADTRDGMVAMGATLARGQPSFLILENVPGAERQEGTKFLTRVAEKCGGGSVTVERRCKDLGVPVSGGRVFTIFLNSVTIKYREELVEELTKVERRVRPMLCEWWVDVNLSEKLRPPSKGSSQFVRKMLPKSGWITGRDDAPTKVGELHKGGRFYANIYDGEGAGALFKRPTRLANRMQNFGVYLYRGELYIPTLRGAARYMGISMKRFSGLDTKDQLLAIGNTIPTKLSASVLRPVLEVLVKHPDIEIEGESLREQPPHVRDVVEAHRRRINQPNYVAAYPRGGHSVVDTYEGPLLPLLSVVGVGGAGLTLRAMVATGLFRVAGMVTADRVGAEAVLGPDVRVMDPSSCQCLRANVVVGGLKDMRPEATRAWESAMEGDWLVLQIRYLGKEGSERQEVRQWMQDLCCKKGDNCALDLTELHTGGYNDPVLAQITVATFTVGVVAARKGKAVTAIGLGVCGALISHLLSPGAVMQSAPRGQRLEARKIAPCKEARQKPMVHAITPEGKEVIDTSGPISYPCDALIGDNRLERKSSGRVCVRELFVKERLSLAGIDDEAAIVSILALRSKVRDNEGWLTEFLALEAPPITNRALALRLYQHLVPQVQEAARRMMHGDDASTRGGAPDLRAVLGEECIMVQVDLPDWDVISLAQDRFFSVGRRMLCVPEGTVVKVVGDRRATLREPEGWCEGDAGGGRF
jgi:site-specific DNA-cytosine methylase